MSGRSAGRLSAPQTPADASRRPRLFARRARLDSPLRFAFLFLANEFFFNVFFLRENALKRNGNRSRRAPRSVFHATAAPRRMQIASLFSGVRVQRNASLFPLVASHRCIDVSLSPVLYHHVRQFRSKRPPFERKTRE